MGLLDGLFEKALREYLADQAEDFKAWFAYELKGIDPGEFSIPELAEKAWSALLNTLEHGSPPPT